MKYIINLKSYRRIAIIFFLLVTITPVIAMIFIVHDEILKERTVVAGFSTDMNEIFKYNDNIATAISSRYLEVIGKDCSPFELGRDFLVNDKRMSAEYKCMLSSLSFINKKASSLNQLKIDLSEFYFYSPEIGLLYLFDGKDANQLDIKDLDLLKKNGLYKRSQPQYYVRLLSIDEKNKGKSSTDIYQDVRTDEDIYTLTSYVYGKEKSKPLGYLYYDHTKKELRSIFNKRVNHNHSDWISAYISSNNHSGSICITERCFTSFIKILEPYSIKYSISVYLDITRLIFGDPVNRTLIITIILLLVLCFVFIAKNSAKQRLISMTDPLTRLYTRDALKYLDLKNTPCFILFDMNNFKLINDNHGHLAGDKALLHASNSIKKNIRTEDIAIRLGGDEFLVVMNNSTLSFASDTALKISNYISNVEFFFNHKKIILSVSFGVSDFKSSISESMEEADKNMYRQKNEMR